MPASRAQLRSVGQIADAMTWHWQPRETPSPTTWADACEESWGAAGEIATVDDVRELARQLGPHDRVRLVRIAGQDAIRYGIRGDDLDAALGGFEHEDFFCEGDAPPGVTLAGWQADLYVVEGGA